MTAFDVLVVGSGGAGLTVALQLPQYLRVGVLSKAPLTEGSTFYAQGGIAAVLDQADSFEAHVEDTLIAGAGLCDRDIVRFVVENAPAAIGRLVDYGVPFTRAEPGSGLDYHLTREGGHRHRRVIHSADATGRAVELSLAEQVRRRPNVTVLEGRMAVDLIVGTDHRGRPRRCIGLYALDLATRQVERMVAKAVVLATGGASKAYLYTSNPDTCTGDGIAMAWRAGCRVSNMEFAQFHPTCLYHSQAKSFLITEAVRGEGGRLVLPDGSRFMDRFDSRAELAPRDIVARAIDHEIKRLGIDCVYLDISHKPADFIREHFPTVYERCRELGIDMTKEPVPVVPAAHYTCGGIVIDRAGRADLDGLYAVGEAACTGLHGANRMASNSLLECFVFGAAVAADIAERWADLPEPPVVAPWDESWVTDSHDEVVVSHNWDELRRFMWDYVGIVRTTKRLKRAKRRVDLLLGEIHEYYGSFFVTKDLLELRNLAVVSDLIIRSALERKESRGLHYSLDYPWATPGSVGSATVLVPGNYARRWD